MHAVRRRARPGIAVTKAHYAPAVHEADPELMPPRRRLGRTPQLDGLRGLAVLVVVVFHANGVLTPLRTQYLPNGFLGVDLFFVLSGFLITALLIGEHDRKQSISFGRFYRRRAMRLLPALLLLLLAHGIYVLIVGADRSLELDTDLAAVFYYMNWWVVAGRAINSDLGHLWTLSIEEQFYLVWPLALLGLLLLLRAVRRLSVIVAILLVGIGGAVLLRIFLWNAGTPAIQIYIRTDARADSLLIGAMLAILWAHDKLPKRGLAVAATLATAFVVVILTRPIGLRVPFFYYGGYTAVAFAFAVIILAALESQWFGNVVLRLGPLCAIGIVSYSLYLWHLPVFAAVSRAGTTWSPAARYVVAFGVTAAATAASWFLLERPVLRWKDRLERRSDERAEARAAAPEPEPVEAPT
jgi:peptidoglycan/LPS O-acetylase OafA/YrhL